MEKCHVSSLMQDFVFSVGISVVSGVFHRRYIIKQCVCSLESCNIRYMMLYKQKTKLIFYTRNEVKHGFSLLLINRMLIYGV